MIHIVIGGDVCPMGRIQNAFVEGKADEIFHDLLDEVASADLSVVNLECPLVSKEMPIEKAGGFVLGANIKCIKGLIASKWNVLNLANNHSFDHGTTGLVETLHTIKESDLAYVGAGVNIQEAQKPFIKEINGQRVVIYSAAEREYSIADEKTAGANPLDLINFASAIRQYKQQGIFIVLIHGGKEYYTYPSPEMVRRCRFMVDMGADAVICSHTHCPLPWEIYESKPIVYGLGNLIFETIQKQPEGWYEGYLAKLTITETNVSLDVIPYIQSKDSAGAKKMKDGERNKFIEDMRKKSEEVKDDEFMMDRWVEYCRQKRDTYLMILFESNTLMRRIRRILFKTKYSKERILAALNLVQCETHQEILNTIFKIERNNNK